MKVLLTYKVIGTKLDSKSCFAYTSITKDTYLVGCHTAFRKNWVRFPEFAFVRKYFAEVCGLCNFGAYIFLDNCCTFETIYANIVPMKLLK